MPQGNSPFSSFYRKGLNSWRQTQPSLYLTEYHKHSCILDVDGKCVWLGGRVGKHRDVTLQHTYTWVSHGGTPV